jgi:hypothetical protein
MLTVTVFFFAVAEEQGILDPKAPAYVTRRRGAGEEGVGDEEQQQQQQQQGSSENIQ